MGDRATLQIKDGKQGIELYTHSGGQVELVDALVSAIKVAPDRLTDAPYFTRIVFCELVKGRERETTGYGIWTPGSLENTGYERFIFDVAAQKIKLGARTFTPGEFVKEFGGVKV